MLWMCPCCNQPECTICEDDYSSAGEGGSGRPCEFTGGGSLVVTGGNLELVAGTPIVYSVGPLTDTTPHKMTVVCEPTDSDGPGTIQLKLSIDGSTFVYGELENDAGNLTLRVGNDEGVLDENTDFETGGISDPVTLELCWTPPLPIGSFEYQVGLFPSLAGTSGAGTAWTNPSAILANDASYASTDSLGEGDTTAALSASFFPQLPPGSTVQGLAIDVNCRENATPAEGIMDVTALLTVASTPLDDKATFSAIPAGSFGGLGYGGATDLWGASSITAEQVNQGVGFGIQFHMPIGTAGGTQPEVNFITLTIWYTSPENEPGILTLRYTNASAPLEPHCAQHRNVFTPGGGVPGLSATDDDFNVTSYNVSNITESCPGCGNCSPTIECDSPCCDEEGSDEFTETLTVDSFDLDNGDGEVVYAISNSSYHGGPCRWADVVSSSIEDGSAFISLGIIQVASGEEGALECFWELYVQRVSNTPGQTFTIDYEPESGEISIEDYTSGDVAVAIYRSAAIEDGACDDFPLTLNLISDDAEGGYSITFPATVEVDVT